MIQTVGFILSNPLLCSSAVPVAVDGGGGGGGGAVAQSVERATPGEQVPGSIPVVAARSLLVETEVMVSQLCLMYGSM